jgi:hypothetical protein
MESAHGVQVCGERIAFSCLKLFNQALHIGGNHFLSGLPWLRLFGVFVDTGNAGVGVHGWFLLGVVERWLMQGADGASRRANRGQG